MKIKICSLAIFLSFFVLQITNSFAGDLSSADQKLIENTGIAMYPEAEFVNGSQDVGFRLATKKPVAEVQAWYTAKMSGWNLYSEYGGWILHDGPAGIGMGEVMARKQVQVKTNPNLSEWFGLDKALSTEIVIMIPR